MEKEEGAARGADRTKAAQEVGVALPKRYQHPDTSGRCVQVREGVNELRPFELTR